MVKSGTDESWAIIANPHPHDVLCGRGGLTNQHAGNEWFRRLVRSNRALYRSCPKHTKLLVAKAIVQAVQQQEPPGRFLEMTDRDAGTWRQITHKRAIDKTSQALREKEQPGESVASVVPSDPKATTEVAQLAAKAAAKKSGKKNADLSDLAKATLRQAGLDDQASLRSQKSRPQRDFASQQLEMDRKRKSWDSACIPAGATWWRQRMAAMNGLGGGPQQIWEGFQGSSFGQANKRMKTDVDEVAPLPLGPLQSRQSSLFRFLGGSGIFGRTDGDQIANASHMEVARDRRSSGFFSFSGGSRNISHRQQPLPNPSDLISMEAAAFEGNDKCGWSSMPGPALNPRQSMCWSNIDPLPLDDASVVNDLRQNVNVNGISSQRQDRTRGNISPGPIDFSRKNGGGPEMEDIPTTGLMGDDDSTPPPINRLTTQVSDWLTCLWSLNNKDDRELQQRQQQQQREKQQELPPPPPVANLERGISSTIFNIARTPSQLLSSLKSGVSSMFGGGDFEPLPVSQSTFGDSGSHAMPPDQALPAPVIGTVSRNGRESLLDDYEESPLETRLRSVTSR